MKNTAVLLGRFSPFQKGHMSVMETMIRKNGVERCLVMIGSSNSYNSRTPFTFEQRKKMIRDIFPDIRIMPLPDINPEKVFFDDKTNDRWLDNLEKIQNKLKTNFVFYGGGKEDLKILGERFETKIAVDRYRDRSISATEVREALSENDRELLEKLLDPKVIPLATKYYQEFLKNSNNE